jgi:hypothetical protein
LIHSIERARVLAPLFEELEGKPARAVARILNDLSVTDPSYATPTGKPWSAVTVLRVRGRLAT